MWEKLEIVEYMPRPVRRLELLLKCCLLLAAGGIVLGFYVRLNNMLGEWRKLDSHRQIYEAYEALLTQGERYLDEGSYEESETCYRKAVTLLPDRQEPYLKLSGLYELTKQYEQAMEVLEAYGGQDASGEISSAILQLKDKMQLLEESVFRKEKEPQEGTGSE